MKYNIKQPVCFFPHLISLPTLKNNYMENHFIIPLLDFTVLPHMYISLNNIINIILLCDFNIIII